MVQRSD
jgi:hypothetical protein